jgi:hypothetical protein
MWRFAPPFLWRLDPMKQRRKRLDLLKSAFPAMAATLFLRSRWYRFMQGCIRSCPHNTLLPKVRALPSQAVTKTYRPLCDKNL